MKDDPKYLFQNLTSSVNVELRNSLLSQIENIFYLANTMIFRKYILNLLYFEDRVRKKVSFWGKRWAFSVTWSWYHANIAKFLNLCVLYYWSQFNSFESICKRLLGKISQKEAWSKELVRKRNVVWLSVMMINTLFVDSLIIIVNLIILLEYQICFNVFLVLFPHAECSICYLKAPGVWSLFCFWMVHCQRPYSVSTILWLGRIISC